jgi:hypothetical protein
VIKSYLRYTLVSSYATYLPPDEFAEVLKPLFTDLYGIKQRPVPWKMCCLSLSHTHYMYIYIYYTHVNMI